MWNPTLGLLGHVQVGVLLDAYLDEAALGRTACTRHFALDLLCDQEDVH